MATTQVELVTPSGMLFSGQADMVVCRTAGGDIAFLANHMPYVGALEPHPLRIVHPEGRPPTSFASRCRAASSRSTTTGSSSCATPLSLPKP